MQNKDRIMTILKKHMGAFLIYADFSCTTFEVEANQFLPEELMVCNCDVLEELYKGNYINEKDFGKYINFYETILYGRKNAISQSRISMNCSMKNRKEEYVPVNIECFFEKDDNDLINGYLARIRLLSEKEIDDERRLAVFTNDKNPSYFIDKIAKFMSAHPDRQYAYIQFDIRNFKYINEKYGSDIGDEILKYISETLDILCDDDHLHCRLTSDMYQVVTYYNNREEIIQFIDMIDMRLHRYQNIRFSMSYGVSIADGYSTEYRRHGDEAGLARVENKRVIMKKVVFYEDTLMVNIKRNGAIEEIEDEALKNGEFHVYLQPKYKYDKHCAHIVGAEALVRWIDADGNCKSPSEFVPVFENNGFILEVDQYMWESVCKLLRKWLDEGKRVVPISVNVSRTYLRKINLVHYFNYLIDTYKIPIDLLQIEITETTENEETLAYVNSLKEAGYTLLMDDFGSGYSSLSMLKETPFDVIKMDRQFLVECLNNNNGKTIVSHIIALSNDLGIDLIAEGVETKEIADFLYDNGCSVSQGFYFSKPISVDDFEKLCFK